MGVSEVEVRSPGSLTVDVTLESDKWVENFDADEAGREVTRLLLRGLQAVPQYSAGQLLASTEPRGWDEVVRHQLEVSSVIRIDETRIRISIPPCINYDIRAPQSVQLVIPPSALQSGVELTSSNTIEIRSVAGIATLSGTLLNATEADVNAGASLIITLGNDVWTADIGTLSLATTELLRSLTSTGAEPSGWSAVIAKALTHEHVNRIDDKSVRIDVQHAGYDLQAPELINLVVPPVSVASRDTNLSAPLKIVIRPTPGTLALSGTLCNGSALQIPGIGNATNDVEVCVSPARWFASGVVCADYLAMVAPYIWVNNTNMINWTLAQNPAYLAIEAVCNESALLNSTIRLKLKNDTWASDVGVETAAGSEIGQRLIDGMYSAQEEATGWTNIVQKLLIPSAIQRLDDTELLVTVPIAPSYHIVSPETIQVYAPADAIVSGQMLVSLPALEIVATQIDIQAALTGSLYEQGEEAFLRSPEATAYLQVHLTNDTW